MRLSALGDVVLALPLVLTLKKAFPEARLSWVIGPLGHSLLEGMPDVKFIVVEKPRSVADYWRFWRRVAGDPCDVLLAAQANYRANFLAFRRFEWVG